MQDNIHSEALLAGNINPDNLARLHDAAQRNAEHLRREAIAQWPGLSLRNLAGALRRLLAWR